MALLSARRVESGNRISIKRTDTLTDWTGDPPLFTVQKIKKSYFFLASSFSFFFPSPPTNKPTNNIITMADNAAPAPAAAEEVKLYKDEVTGEMISKSYVSFFFSFPFFLTMALFFNAGSCFQDESALLSCRDAASCYFVTLCCRCKLLLFFVLVFVHQSNEEKTNGKEQQSSYTDTGSTYSLSTCCRT